MRIEEDKSTKLDKTKQKLNAKDGQWDAREETRTPYSINSSRKTT